MNVRTALPLSAALVVAAGALAPALAAAPKPVTVEWDMTEHLPVPSPVATGIDGDNSCADPALEGISTTTQTLKTTGAGTLVVDLTAFAGDWDVTVTDDKGRVLGIGSGTTTGGEATGEDGSLGTENAEKATVKTTKAMTLVVRACNYLGGPDAHGKAVFTYKG